jgi:hypothetical protein
MVLNVNHAHNILAEIQTQNFYPFVKDGYINLPTRELIVVKYKNEALSRTRMCIIT